MHYVLLYRETAAELGKSHDAAQDDAYWEDVLGADAKRKGLAEEAIWLGRLVAELLPDDPEAMGLLALMLHCEARRAARRGKDGAFVALADQDLQLWSRPMVLEAERLLRAAALHRTPGRFQTEAAIQSLHAQSRKTGGDLRVPLVRLYDLLVDLAPSTGAAVARAVALAEAGDADAALAQLDGLSGCETYQSWWAARARVLWLRGDEREARAAASIAAGLSDDPAVRALLLGGGRSARRPRHPAHDVAFERRPNPCAHAGGGQRAAGPDVAGRERAVAADRGIEAIARGVAGDGLAARSERRGDKGAQPCIFVRPQTKRAPILVGQKFVEVVDVHDSVAAAN